MTDFITVRVQIGLNKEKRFDKTVPQDSTIEDLRRVIRHNLDLDISSSDGVVLISNGQSLKNPNITLADLGICSESLIICIISKQTGREIEKLFNNEEDTNYENGKITPVLECVFHSRPFGFAVWANERGRNAIVTKVAGNYALQSGIQIGYCAYKINDTPVFNKSHDEVFEYLKNWKCPLRITFIDLGREYAVAFQSKPMGFTVVQDREGNNAKVSKIIMKKAGDAGVKIGSYVTAVNNVQVFGSEHRKIISTINQADFPIILKFRRPPKLLILSRRKK